MNYSEKVLKMFVKDHSLPIQLITNEMLEYYIDLYDLVLNTKEKWNSFISAISNFESEEDFVNKEHSIINKIVDNIKNNPLYKEFTECDMDIMMPIHKDVEGVPFTKSPNIYRQDYNGKYFISIDMCKANYQALKLFSSSIIFNSDTYEQMIEQFTDLEYFKKSKHIRQVIFGQLNMNRISRQE